MINSEKRKRLENDMKEITNGAAYISTEQVGKLLGLSRQVARRYTHGLPKTGSKYYIPEVVEKILIEQQFVGEK